MRRVLHSTAFLCFALLWTNGCVVRVPLEGRPCPCDEARGWFCDPRSSTCRTESEGFCGVEGAARSSISIEDVRIAWRTDTAMEVAWTVPVEDQPSIDHFELVVGTSADDVLDGVGSAVRFDPSNPEHPELRRRGLPDTSGGDPVDSSVLRDLEPDTQYFVQLLVFDLESRVQCTSTVSALTYPRIARAPIVLYDEVRFGGALPVCIQHVTDPALASSGSAFARYTARCVPNGCDMAAPALATCFENVRVQGLDPGPISIPAGPFREVAHLQVDVALDDTPSAYWSEMFLLTNARQPSDDPNALPGPHYLWAARRQTIVGDGEYRTYSTPLAQMVLRCFDDQLDLDRARFAADPTVPRQCGRLALDPSDLALGVVGVRVGVNFVNLGTMRLDRAVLRY